MLPRLGTNQEFCNKNSSIHSETNSNKITTSQNASNPIKSFDDVKIKSANLIRKNELIGTFWSYVRSSWPAIYAVCTKLRLYLATKSNLWCLVPNQINTSLETAANQIKSWLNLDNQITGQIELQILPNWRPRYHKISTEEYQTREIPKYLSHASPKWAYWDILVLCPLLLASELRRLHKTVKLFGHKVKFVTK